MITNYYCTLQAGRRKIIHEGVIEMAKQALILYYSQFGNTAKLAGRLHQLTGADILQLKVPAGTFPNDMQETDKVYQQQLTAGHLPPITTTLPDLNYYDLVLLGGPVWDGKVASPVLAALQMLQGYQGEVAPFSSAWSDTGKYQEDFIAHAGKLKVVAGYHVLTHANPRFNQLAAGSWLRKL